MYLFESERLGFRPWKDSDLAPIQALNQDPAVMEFFPALKSLAETMAFVARMQRDYAERGYCFFAVDRLDAQRFIGFIGLSQHTYLEEQGAVTEIGWRLQQRDWNQGFATEGARACLQYGFGPLQLPAIYAATPHSNIKSQRVMEKIGMQFVREFEEERIGALNPCWLYRILPAGH
jgi:RimJ/RimL family protein N-acetyltransferase